eukprot:5048525-Amphidinium_carterae.1
MKAIANRAGGCAGVGGCAGAGSRGGGAGSGGCAGSCGCDAAGGTWMRYMVEPSLIISNEKPLLYKKEQIQVPKYQ